MRLTLLSGVAALALIATPVLAQSQSAPQSGAESPAASSQSSTSTFPQGAKITLDTQRKLRQSLQQAGFRNIRVTAESYVIHALSPDGAPVVMVVSPDQVTGVIEQSGSSTPQSQSSQSQNPNSQGNQTPPQNQR